MKRPTLLGMAVVVALGACEAAAADPAAAGADTPTLDTVVVTGSRIPRLAAQGPAPVVTITSEDIKNDGFANAADIMSSLSQNLGDLENNQATDGFSPGAQAVDLRGLGPNHTLVLVNGRRIADYPQAYKGNSNFTDISNIPAGMIDRIEILSGSASAVYGSDAIAGVINIILKQKADGTTVDVRLGDTQHGGGGSQRLQISSGYSNGRFDSVFAVELLNQDPLWAFQRNFTNSRLDSPASPGDIFASPVFTLIDVNGNYIDPGQATCNSLAHLDQGSIVYASRSGYAPDNNGGPGYYCGSYKDVGYGTLENGRRAATLYGSGTYALNDHTKLFLDVQLGYSHQISYNTPLQWENSYQLNGDSTPVPFYNAATQEIEQWQRRYFTLEENGSLQAGEIHNIDATLSVNTGLKGSIGDSNWSYEALFGYARNSLESKEPALVSAKAQALFLGPSLGIDPNSGYNIYNAPLSRLYTPLTVAQFQSITQLSIDHDQSHNSNVTLTVNNNELFRLPAGPVGFAGVAEYGSQYFGLVPDPLSLDGSYFGLHNTTAVGSRTHMGFGAEFSAPVFSQLRLSGAGRFDSYHYSDTTAGRFTYNLGLEYRPVTSLLIRGSLGTGFRAPDLAYLYAGLSGSSSDGTDYYLCRLNEPGSGPDYYDNCSNGDVSFNGRSHGSTALKDETSVSLTYGIDYQPTKNFDISADYYAIKLSNEVEYQSSDTVLREEADCRLGQTLSGQTVDINSGLCQQVLSQVVRNPATDLSNPLGITSVLVLPINAAVDRTTGFDVAARYLQPAGALGSFEFKLWYSRALTHTIQYFAGDPVVDEFSDLFDYVIPKDKASASVTWRTGNLSSTIHGSRLGGLPNYEGTARLSATYLYNASINYDIVKGATVSLIIDNLFDTKPQRDSTWTSYPYYASDWYSPIGRAFFLEASYRIGGRAKH